MPCAIPILSLKYPYKPLHFDTKYPYIIFPIIFKNPVKIYGFMCILLKNVDFIAREWFRDI